MEFMKECVISGVEDASEFNLSVPEKEIEEKCKDIWNYPNKYSKYQPKTEDAYYKFLKFLWVKFPDGTEKRLADIACP